MATPLKDFNEHVIKVVNEVSRGVVTITTVKLGFESIFGTVPIRGLGSGFLIGENIIVTNAHVVSDARVVDVIFFDGSRFDGKVYKADTYRDVALVSVENVPKDIKPLPLGDSNQLRVGE